MAIGDEVNPDVGKPGRNLEPVTAAVPTWLLYWDNRVGICDRRLAFPSVLQPFGEASGKVIKTFDTAIPKAMKRR